MKKILPLLSLVLALVLFALPAAGHGEEEDGKAQYEGYGEIQGDTLVLREGITALGEPVTERWNFEEQLYEQLEARFESGPSFWAYSEGEEEVHQIVFPASFRFLGAEALGLYHFTTFTLPAQMKGLEPDSLVYCWMDVLRIEAEIPAEEILGGLFDCTVRAYEVPEDHPTLRTVDGVLFSKDGKTLISYPNGREEPHYDVPAGVERIAKGAFGNEYLVTVSLPIGLKAIEDYGFSGCSRLQSLSVPLTVTVFGREVFEGCASLELLSLPRGLEANKNSEWTQYYPDDEIFRGDNGDTLAGKKSTGRIDAAGRVRKSETSWCVDLYAAPGGAETGELLATGRIIEMGAYQDGYAEAYDPLTGRMMGWVKMEQMEYLPAQTLFSYAEMKPRETMEVWWVQLPDGYHGDPWETKIPLEGKYYDASFFGQFVRFRQLDSGAMFACRIEDLAPTRIPDGSGNVYGIVYRPREMDAWGDEQDLSLMRQPGGDELKKIMCGTQVRILGEQDGWVHVSDGRDEGWVEQRCVLIVPEAGPEGSSAEDQA